MCLSIHVFIGCGAEDTDDAPQMDMGQIDMTMDSAPTVCRENEHLVQSKCEACPPGTTRKEQEPECRSTPCDVNEYVFLNTCLSCPEGQTNDAGDDPAGDRTRCDALLCAQDERVEGRECVACPGDLTNDAGDDASGEDTTCDATLCALNQRVNAHACMNCPTGAYTFSEHDAAGEDTYCTHPPTLDVLAIMGCINRGARDASCWGRHGLIDADGNSSGHLPDVGDDLRQVTPSGASGGCLVTMSGQLWCWGGNDQGEVGDGTFTARTMPTRVMGIDEVAYASSASSHTCAVRKDGTVWCWGDNEKGALGVEGVEQSSSPVKVPGLEDIMEVDTILHRTCAINRYGKAWCWGNNEDGVIGLPKGVETTSTPTPLTALERVKKIKLGGSYSCALTHEGEVWCWGQVGVRLNLTFTAGDRVYGPRRLSGFDDIVQFDFSSTNGCMLSASGDVNCWGETDTYFTRTSLDSNLPPGPYLMSPGPFMRSGEVVEMSVGYQVICQRLMTGNVYCTGSNDYGLNSAPRGL